MELTEALRMQTKSKNHFIPYFDGLRGLAALVVFFGHTACSIYPVLTSGNKDLNLSGLAILSHLTKTPFSLLTAANSAVCIFFVLSGYVMVMVSDRSKESFIAISVRRYFRLAGPAAISCLFSAWLLKNHFYYNQAVADLTLSSWLKQWFLFDGSYKSALAQGLVHIFQVSSSSYNSSLWTMYIEFWGSLSIFAICYLFSNKTLRFAAFGMTAIIAANHFHRYDFFCIFAGAISYSIYQSFNVRQKLPHIGRISTICVLFGIYLCSFPDFAPNGHGGRFYNWISSSFEATWYHTWGAILTVHFIHQTLPFKNFFSSPLLLWLGRISFSLYLIHLPIICSVGAYLVYVLQPVVSYNIMGLTFIICVGGLSLLLAEIYTRSVDIFFIRFGRLISKQIDHFFPAVTKQTTTRLDYSNLLAKESQ